MMNMNTISAEQAVRTQSPEPSQLYALLDQLCPPAGAADRGGAAWSGAQSQEEALRQSREKLERLAERYTLMLDTGALLHPQFPNLVEHLTPLLRRSGKALLIPDGVVAELRTMAGRGPDRQDQVLTAARRLCDLQAQGLARIFDAGVPGAVGTDGLLAAARRLSTVELLVVTQDNDRSAALMALNQPAYGRERRLGVSRINRYGYLSRYRLQTDDPTGVPSRSVSRSHSVSQSHPAAPAAQVRVFPAGGARPFSGSLSRPAAQAAPDRAPGTGSRLRSADGSRGWTLGRAVAAGREGILYALEDGSVAKVYHPGLLTAERRETLARMAARLAPCDGVCWPLDVLCTGDGRFAGYRMARASGQSLQRCLASRESLEALLPGGKKEDLVRLAVTILEKVCALHRSGVRLGAVRPEDILVVSPEEVWLVGCDGYPAEDSGDKGLSLATLLFTLMLPGHGADAQAWEGRLDRAIQALEFPQLLEEQAGEPLLPPSWPAQWSQLPRFLRDCFCGTFLPGGQYGTGETRLPDYKWLSVFQNYLDLLRSGRLEARDPQAAALFPAHGRCADAGDRAEGERRICVDCGAEFYLSDSERDYYLGHGLDLPRRCPSCRKQRKLRQLRQAG